MLKRAITFEDLDGNTVTEEFYFNLSKTELLELETGYENGSFSAALQRIIDSKNVSGLISEFKKLVLLAYGQKSADGKRFIKSDQLREEFSQTPAYDALFMELVTDDNAAAAFIQGIVPKDLSATLQQQNAQMLNQAAQSIIDVEAVAETGTALPPPPPSV